MAEGIREVAALPDPVGPVLDRVERPNGLVIEKTAVPMGVIAIIYESRPNVTCDAAALALKSGNACVLRGGKEAYRSAARHCGRPCRQGLPELGLPGDRCQPGGGHHPRQRQRADDTPVGYVDLLIPRGGAGLIRACVENATVPCIQTGTGICHIYVDDVCRPGHGAGHHRERQGQPPSASATPRRSAWFTAASRPGFPAQACASGWADRPHRQGLPPGGAAAGPARRPPSSPAPRRARRTSTPSFWTTSWPSRSWTAWRRPSPTSPPTPPATARPSSPQDAGRAARFTAAGGQRRRLCQRLHPLHRRRRVRPGLRDGHLHPEAPRPGPHGAGRSCAATSTSSMAAGRSVKILRSFYTHFTCAPECKSLSIPGNSRCNSVRFIAPVITTIFLQARGLEHGPVFLYDRNGLFLLQAQMSRSGCQGF